MKCSWSWYWTIGDMEGSDESASNPIPQGCGSSHSHISIHISPTTGGDFFVNIDPDSTVENLKKLVSKKLKVSRDRICLLYREKWVSTMLQYLVFELSLYLFLRFLGNSTKAKSSITALRMVPKSRYCLMSKLDWW